MKTLRNDQEDDMELDKAISEFEAAVVISYKQKITMERYKKMHYYISSELQEQLQKLIIDKSNFADNILD